MIRNLFEEKKEKIRRGDELPPGVIKLVKVYVAMKRKLSVGDKMAGRHGNKGVIARILPEEELPVPAGWDAGGNRAQPARRAVADERRADSRDPPRVGGPCPRPVLRDAGLRRRDRARDQELARSRRASQGRQDQAVRRGCRATSSSRTSPLATSTLLKLSHPVDDKIHARSMGQLAITQQPLGAGRSLATVVGEMGLGARGPARHPPGVATAKSTMSRAGPRLTRRFVKGDASFSAGLPESFNVLIRELQSLCLDVELMKTKEEAGGRHSSTRAGRGVNT